MELSRERGDRITTVLDIPNRGWTKEDSEGEEVLVSVYNLGDHPRLKNALRGLRPGTYTYWDGAGEVTMNLSKDIVVLEGPS